MDLEGGVPDPGDPPYVGEGLSAGGLITPAANGGLPRARNTLLSVTLENAGGVPDRGAGLRFCMHHTFGFDQAEAGPAGPVASVRFPRYPAITIRRTSPSSDTTRISIRTSGSLEKLLVATANAAARFR